MNIGLSNLRFCSLAAATVLLLSLEVNAGELHFVEQPIPGQYIVVLKEDAATKLLRLPVMRAEVVANEMGRGLGFKVLRTYDRALRGFAIKASDRALASVVADPRVDFVEEDGVVRVSGTQSGATWGLDRSDQRDSTLNGIYNYDTTAATVHAYIIDTGIFPGHNDFGGRVSGGFTAIDDGNGTTDCHYHGTHVAGTVGGTRWGIAKQVQLHPVRVLSCTGYGTNSGVIAGVDWVAANHVKPAVVNMSLGGGASKATDMAIARLVAAGVVAVVAAGNDSTDACKYSPARAPAALTVAATARGDNRAAFSNFGQCVDLFAPGQDVMSASIFGPDLDASIAASGTSMASPHVAGAVALYLAKNPNATPAEASLAVIKLTTKGQVGDVGGSPNRLLFTKGFNGVDGPIFINFAVTSTGPIARFSHTTTTTSGSIVKQVWEFGDGGTSTAASGAHIYPRGGTYNVTLTVTDNAGYIASSVKSVTVR